MAFQEASKKAQRALRRVIPKMLGDFVDQEPMSPEEQKEILVKKRDSCRKRREELENTPNNSLERKFLGCEMFELQGKIAELNREINKKRSYQQTCLNDYIIQTAKEMLGDNWPECIAEARLRANRYGFREDKKQRRS